MTCTTRETSLGRSNGHHTLHAPHLEDAEDVPPDPATTSRPPAKPLLLRLVHCARAFLYCLVGSATYRRRRRQLARYRDSRNSVSSVDRTSRVVFPVLFVIFNVFYWLVYCTTALQWSENQSQDEGIL